MSVWLGGRTATNEEGNDRRRAGELVHLAAARMLRRPDLSVEPRAASYVPPGRGRVNEPFGPIGIEVARSAAFTSRVTSAQQRHTIGPTDNYARQMWVPIEWERSATA